MTTPTPPSNEGKTLKCTHCGNIWDYSGSKQVNATCTDCNLRTNIKDSLMMISLIASLTILGGLGVVFADEITLQTSFPISGYNCIEDNNDQYPYAECYIQGHSFFIGKDDISYSWDIIEEKYTPTAQLIEEAKQIYQDSIIIAEEKSTKTGLEKRIEYLENKTNPTQDDLAELNLLHKAGALCYNNTLVSQTYRAFSVAIEDFLDLDGNWKSQLIENFAPTAESFRDSPYEKRINLGIQECIAQPFTKKSVQYDHMFVDNEHTPLITHQSKAAGLTGYSQDDVNRMENKSQEFTFYNSACPLYNERSRVMLGCGTVYTENSTDTQLHELRNYSMTSPYQNKLKYDEDPNDDLDRYKKRILESKPTTYGGGYP